MEVSDASIPHHPASLSSQCSTVRLFVLTDAERRGSSLHLMMMSLTTCMAALRFLRQLDWTVPCTKSQCRVSATQRLSVPSLLSDLFSSCFSSNMKSLCWSNFGVAPHLSSQSIDIMSGPAFEPSQRSLTTFSRFRIIPSLQNGGVGESNTSISSSTLSGVIRERRKSGGRRVARLYKWSHGLLIITQPSV